MSGIFRAVWLSGDPAYSARGIHHTYAVLSRKAQDENPERPADTLLRLVCPLVARQLPASCLPLKPGQLADAQGDVKPGHPAGMEGGKREYLQKISVV